MEKAQQGRWHRKNNSRQQRITKHRGGSDMAQREHHKQDRTEVLRVSSKSKPNAVAGAVAGVIREKGRVEIQIIGAGALNQAIKAIAIARGFLAPSGIDIVCIPSFCDVVIDGQERTAIRLVVEART
ncbi:MAG: hypothetical protein RUDDFDWM_000215 [Candidatus Fervidibacterota bacterium]